MRNEGFLYVNVFYITDCVNLFLCCTVPIFVQQLKKNIFLSGTGFVFVSVQHPHPLIRKTKFSYLYGTKKTKIASRLPPLN